VARIRGVKPELFRHEGLQELGSLAMLVFIGLFTQADYEGRFVWKPRQLKLDILPFIDYNIEETLDALRGGGFITRYEVDGRSYGVIPKFRKHQYTTGKEPASKLPAPPSDMYPTMTRTCSVNDEKLSEISGHTESESESEKSIVEDAILDGAPRAAQGEDLPKRLEFSQDVPASPEKLAESPKPTKVTVPTALAELIYRAYPRHVAPGDAREAILKAIVRIAKADGISQSDAAEKLLQRVERYAVQVKRAGKEMEFVPYPATWLNKERYDDDSLRGESPGAPGYTDTTSVYETPEYQSTRRSA
jgi:hypothetical protein